MLGARRPLASVRSLRVVKLRRAVVVLLLINLVIASGFWLRGSGGSGASVTTAGAIPALVDQRIKALDLTDDERRWENVGWVYDVDEALRLSRSLKRPVLAYVLNGQLDGRC